MSLWPILQHRRRDDAHTPLTPMSESLQAGESLSTAGSFEHTAAQILRQTLEVTGAGSAVIFRLDPDAALIVPILIGPAEASAIASAQAGIVPPRPMTHDLLRDAVPVTRRRRGAVS